MSQAAKLDLTIEQGATVGWQFTVKDSRGAPLDLSGCTIRSQVKANIGDSTFLATFSCVITDPYSGIFRVSLTRKESSKLNARKAVFDAFMDTADGQTIKLLAGNLIIIQKVTE